MEEPSRQLNISRLKRLKLAAVMAGFAVAGMGLYLGQQWSDPDLAIIVASVAIAGAVYGAIFYFGCLILEGSLNDYIVSDDTVIKGERVETVTTTRTSGDAEIDKWVASFTFARNLFGMAIVPLLLLGGIFLFA